MGAVILGHSFVTRLHKYLNPSSTTHVVSHSTQLSFIAEGGCRLQGHKFNSLMQSLNSHMVQHPSDVLIIQLGTNDIDSGDSPGFVATALYNLANHLQSTYRFRYVFISTIINRDKHLFPSFEQRAKDTNKAISSLVTHLGNPRIRVWHHRNMDNPQTRVLDRYGVHLNKVGMKKYWRSVRGAISYAAHH